VGKMSQNKQIFGENKTLNDPLIVSRVGDIDGLSARYQARKIENGSDWLVYIYMMRGF